MNEKIEMNQLIKKKCSIPYPYWKIIFHGTAVQASGRVPIGLKSPITVFFHFWYAQLTVMRKPRIRKNRLAALEHQRQMKKNGHDRWFAPKKGKERVVLFCVRGGGGSVLLGFGR